MQPRLDIKRRPVGLIDPGEPKHWAKIMPRSEPLLAAVQKIIDDLEDFWPVSLRQIHYGLLNDPPLVGSTKYPDMVYQNTSFCNSKLKDLMSKARVFGRVPWDRICDETRPETTWPVHAAAREFVKHEMGRFLSNYWRDLMQTQPNHIEIVFEKNTVGRILKPVALEFCIPMTSMRGYSSFPPLWHIHQRFHTSGKNRLIVLVVTDFDPSGEEIARSLANTLEFGMAIDEIVVTKVVLRADQVDRFDLPPGGKAKKEDKNYDKFVAKYGSDVVFELEALEPSDLQMLLRESIESAIDMDAYRHELEQEARDEERLAEMKESVTKSMLGLDDE